MSVSSLSFLAQPSPAVNNSSGRLGTDAERPSRFDSFNRFVDRGQAVLRRAGCASAAILWFTLWRSEDAATGLVRIGVGTLAERTGIDRRNVQRALAQLQAHGFLEVADPGKPGRGSCAVYRLRVPEEKASQCPLSESDKGVMVTPFQCEDKGVIMTPIEEEKASWQRGKGVTMTHVQKEQKKKEEKKSARAAAPKEKTPGEEDASPREAGEHQQAVALFCERWQSHYGAKYPFAPRDARNVKNILERLGGIEAFRKAVERFFASPDPWFVNNRHRLADLDSQLVKFSCDAPSGAPMLPGGYGKKTRDEHLEEIMAKSQEEWLRYKAARGKRTAADVIAEAKAKAKLRADEQAMTADAAQGEADQAPGGARA